MIRFLQPVLGFTLAFQDLQEPLFTAMQAHLYGVLAQHHHLLVALREIIDTVFIAGLVLLSKDLLLW
ncbi:MAG: hypothetical protein GYA15_14580 [Leptolinea sp.]|nr:hypothetical protein [Leptolinea sp.]